MRLLARLVADCPGAEIIVVDGGSRDASRFEWLGGYADIPLMEDVEFTRRLKRVGRLACLRRTVVTSARKWEQEGVLRTICLLWWLRLLYWLGVPPQRLHRWYYPQMTNDQ